MAKTTTAALQAAIDTAVGHDAGTMSPVRILQETHDSATYSRWYVEGNPSQISATQDIDCDKAMWVKTTVAFNDAAQASEIISAFQETNSNVDPDAEV